MTKDEEQDALSVLVAPWLPNATVESLNMEERCGCYSEWTQEPPRYEVTFRAPRPEAETDRDLSNIVRVLEGIVMRFAQQEHAFSGCSSCCEDGDTDNVRPSLWVRVIRARPLAMSADAVGQRSENPI